MNAPVDLTNLREMIGDDPDIEKEFIEKFYEAAEKCLSGMHDGLATNQNEVWRSNAHAFKGISLNLGAAELGTLCANAQFGFEGSAADKQALLVQIKAEFDAVKKYLSGL